ncbi:DUF3667 domain-containing protein [Psychroserpens ponticola]|uniref:DUF3667 domain-containing protein n=1 Tax=Psychroserpens ponticola TaxID=2932268 RepID=A0ABY7RZD4_9FLAO|nr:DUF3667 domain-containing protein [Psychroserpens ponticola]WCO02442.1 DUF3667 domain-containing protein [Psychroserpens ponticola]
MNCKNCNTSLSKLINYCPLCGAKIVKKRLTFKNLSVDITEQFLNIDNKFLKTFLHLFTKPELVIDGFISGTRKKYINVIQYFAVALTLVGVQVFLMNNFFLDAMELDNEFLKKALENQSNQENNPFSSFSFEDSNNYQSIIYILSVPISTISTWIAYYVIGIRHYNFTEHLVINLYYSAQIIIVSAVLSILFLCFGLDYLLISGVISVLTFGYFFFVFKRVFNSSFWDSVLHFILIMVAYFIIFITILLIVIAIVAVYAILNKDQLVHTV